MTGTCVVCGETARLGDDRACPSCERNMREEEARAIAGEPPDDYPGRYETHELQAERLLGRRGYEEGW